MAENDNWWKNSREVKEIESQDNWWENSQEVKETNTAPTPPSPDGSTNVSQRDIAVPTQADQITSSIDVDLNPNVEAPDIKKPQIEDIKPSLPPEVANKEIVQEEGNKPKSKEAELSIDPVSIEAETTENLPDYLKYKPFAIVRKDVDPDSLNVDRDWIAASDRVYALLNQGNTLESDTDMAEYGKDLMGWFNYNLPSMAYISNYVLQADQETKEAFLWMMDTYDNTDYSWDGFKRFASGLALDPTTYAGVATLGSGFFAKFATKTAAKATLKAKLLQSIGRTGVPASLEGGLYVGGTDALKQNIEISAGRMDEFDYTRSAKMTGLGLGGGIVLGTSGDLVFGGLVNTVKFKTKNFGSSPDVEPVSSTVSRDLDFEKQPVFVTPNQTSQNAKIDVPEVKTTKDNSPRSLSELSQEGLKIKDQIKDLDNATLQDVLAKIEASDTDELFGRLLTPEERDIIISGIGQHLDDVQQQSLQLNKKINEVDADISQVQASIDLRRQADELDAREAMLFKTYEEMSAKLGFGLRALQEQSFEKIPTIKQLQEAEGLTLTQAREKYIQLAESSQAKSEVARITKEYEPRIQQAINEGRFNDAAKLTAQRTRLTEAVEATLFPEKAGLMAKATEWAISNVFTVKTLIMNTIPSGAKTVIIPGLNAILNNPLNKATRVEMYAAYKAMGINAKTAFKASLEAMKYEQSLLTRDSNRILESGSAFEGRWGGFVRLFPRLLNATDEFMSQINYASFVSAKAAGKAAQEATELGYKGKQFDSFVRQKTEEAMNKAFEGAKGDDLINPIISKGMNRGYTGDKLFDWVEKQIAGDSGLLSKLGYKKDMAAFRMAKDDDALKFVRDVLYKRDFSGEGTGSTLAKSADEMFRNNPWLKLTTGQLFLRTPIRVFEEGFRLTPGLQFASKKFRDDLMGKNGLSRQTRARGEALFSQALAQQFFLMYAKGEITGAGTYSNYDQIKNRRDTDKPQPYTIKFDDGSTWSYRNFDPLATPFKILTNAFDGMKMLDLRQAQGEFIDDSLYEKYEKNIIVGIVAIYSGIKDAGLFEGLNQIDELFKIANDPESKDSSILRYVRDKMNLVMPNTIRKVAKNNDPFIRDPKDFYQVVETTFIQPVQSFMDVNNRTIKTPFSYDALGNKRKLSSSTTTLDPTGAALDFFATESLEERGKGKSDQELAVLSALDDLSKTTDLTIRPPVKHPDIPDLDLRTVMTKDGTQTLYDRFQEIYRGYDPVTALYAIIQANPPTGTRKQKGMAVELIRDTLADFRSAAMSELLGEQQEMIDKAQTEAVRAVEKENKTFKSY
jgi:hypothetical protein